MEGGGAPLGSPRDHELSRLDPRSHVSQMGTEVTMVGAWARPLCYLCLLWDGDRGGDGGREVIWGRIVKDIKSKRVLLLWTSGSSVLEAGCEPSNFLFSGHLPVAFLKVHANLMVSISTERPFTKSGSRELCYLFSISIDFPC